MADAPCIDFDSIDISTIVAAARRTFMSIQDYEDIAQPFYERRKIACLKFVEALINSAKLERAIKPLMPKQKTTSARVSATARGNKAYSAIELLQEVLVEMRRGQMGQWGTCEGPLWNESRDSGSLPAIASALPRLKKAVEWLDSIHCSASVQTAKRSTTNPKRDKYIYETRAKGKTLQQVFNAVNKRWRGTFSSLQAVSAAAKRHSKAQGLPWPIVIQR